MYSNRLKELNGIANNSFTQVNNSGALIASTAATVTSGGIVNFPSTPLVTAYVNTTTAGVTGAGTVYTTIFDTVLTQVGSGYNSTTGVYTIPTAAGGVYFVGGSVGFGSLTAAMTQGIIRVVTTSRTYETAIFNYGALKDSANNAIFSYGLFVNVSAADTVKINVLISNGAGNTATVLGLDTGLVQSYFSFAKVA